MTLIATLAVDNVPVLFGDLLITGPRPVERALKHSAVAVPTLGDVQDFFGDSGWGVLGLAQKVCVVNDDCAIAWAGSKLGARIVIGELRRRLMSSPLTHQEILAYLQSEPELKRHPASFIGLLKEGDDVWQFHLAANSMKRRGNFGPSFYSGSGCKAYTDYVNILGSAQFRSDMEAGTNDLVIAQALGLGGTLLRAEMEGGDAARTLREQFGGGYEVAYFSERSMRKVEVTYVFWEARRSDRSHVELSFPFFMARQAYVGDSLLVRSARFDFPTSFVHEQMHVIGPMWCAPPITLPALRDFSFDSALTCHCVLLRGPQGQISAIRNRIVRTDVEAQRLRFRYNDDAQLRGVEYGKELVDTLIDSIDSSSSSLNQPK